MLRHGIAEKEAGSDAERALTAGGAKKIVRVSAGIQSMLKKNAKTAIWSSPLLRASQTAQILADRLKVKKIKEVGALAAGEGMLPLLSEWAGAKTSDVLIVVSHQPFLTEWSAELTGNPLPFKKGGAAGYGIGENLPLEANLRWFIQPGAWPPDTK